MIADGLAKAGGGYGSAGSPIAIHLPSQLDLKIPPPEVTVNIPPQHIDVHVPEQPAPQVTVNLPEAKPPVVNVAAAKALGPQEVIVTSMPPRVHTAKRDRKGQIEGSIEVDA